MFISEDGIKDQLSEYLDFGQAIFSVKLGVSLLPTTIHPFFYNVFVYKEFISLSVG